IARSDWRASLMQEKTMAAPSTTALHSFPLSSANTRAPSDAWRIVVLANLVIGSSPCPSLGWRAEGGESSSTGVRSLVRRVVDGLRTTDDGLVPFCLERQPVRLSQALDDRLERREDRRGQSDDRTDRHGDRPARALWPVGHRQAGHQPANQLAALAQQLPGGGVQRLERDLEIGGDQLSRRVTPGRISHRAAFGPHAEMSDRLGAPVL